MLCPAGGCCYDGILSGNRGLEVRGAIDRYIVQASEEYFNQSTWMMDDVVDGRQVCRVESHVADLSGKLAEGN